MSVCIENEVVKKENKILAQSFTIVQCGVLLCRSIHIYTHSFSPIHFLCVENCIFCAVCFVFVFVFVVDRVPQKYYYTTLLHMFLVDFPIRVIHREIYMQIHINLCLCLCFVPGVLVFVTFRKLYIAVFPFSSRPNISLYKCLYIEITVHFFFADDLNTGKK